MFVVNREAKAISLLQQEFEGLRRCLNPVGQDEFRRALAPFPSD